jgi:hypothetical protein
MELYSAWKCYADEKMEGLRVIVQDQRGLNEKKKKIVLKNLVSAGYDIQKLLHDYASCPTEQSFRRQLENRIQSMKLAYESYLLDTRCARTEEVVSTVMRFLKTN